jgi:endonuclease/exonuclease/phosphatase (EEP) superfamily protein YafD
MRVATFNLLDWNDRMDDVAKFLAASDADVIVLEETTHAHLAKLRQALRTRYPHILGDWSIVILSKHPILAHGRVDPEGYPPWVSPMARWARIEVKGVAVEIAGVHLARPFHPALQDQDYAALTAFLRSRDLPLVVVGDFNAAPWTVRFADLTRTTGLAPHNTLYPTWPMELRDIPILPLVPIDNVATSREFMALGAEAGPRLGSDHRPFIADIALSEPRPASAE